MGSRLGTAFTESFWEGFRRLDFIFNDRPAILILPNEEQPPKYGRLTMYTEYFGAFANTAVELVNRGYCLAYLDNTSRWGLDADSEARRDFVDFLAERYNLRPRFAAIGMSAGGVSAVNFASLYPDYISVLYLDAPLLNFISCFGYVRPPRREKLIKEILKDLKMTESQMLGYRQHPMDKLHVLAAHDIPVVICYGDIDASVDYNENGKLLADYYEACGKGHLVKVFRKEGCGHHPHGLPDPKPIADFITEHDSI
jgi:alpha-beta hydrolase superfamily lysophospholipase